jgi:hypothetical protein
VPYLDIGFFVYLPISSLAFHSISWFQVVEQRRYSAALWLLPPLDLPLFWLARGDADVVLSFEIE